MNSGRSLQSDLESGPNERGMDEEIDDFDDSADELWSLYEKVAKRYDEARIRALKDDMDGIPVYAGLLSAVIAAFVVPKLQDLQVNPAQQSVYYQQQSAQILAQLSQQIASIGTQIPLNVSYISPYSTPHSSASDCRVAVFWLISLVFSLSAVILSALVPRWVRAYMGIYHRSGSTSKKARTRQYFFEGVERLPVVAEVAHGLVHLSLILFLLGLADAVLKIDRTVGIATVVPMVFCGSSYLYYVIVPITKPQSPYRNLFSDLILLVIQNLRRGRYHGRPRPGVWHARIEALQETPVIELTKRKDLYVRAIRWLVDNMDRKKDMETFVLAIPGIFNQKWGREVWTTFSTQGDLLSSQKGTPVNYLHQYVEEVFEIHRNEENLENKKSQRKRMHGCIETLASLVCCTDVQLDSFGKVGEALSDLGTTEGNTKLSIIGSNSSFTVRWTCLSLVAIRKMTTDESSSIRERARSVVDGIARFQSDYGASDALAFAGAQQTDEYLKTAWKHVMDLYGTFVPRDQNGTEEEIRDILEGCESQISGLERIANTANDMESVDWRVSLLQDAMDRATNNLMRRLPGVSFIELNSSGPISIAKAFDFPTFGSTPIMPQFIFPGQQVQALCTLGRELRDIVENWNPERFEEAVRTLESIQDIPIPSRHVKDLMIHQLWRLQDLRDGGGLGFTIELFFLAIRQLSSTSSPPELKRVFYTGTFKAITAGWEDTTDSPGTQRILLNIVCDIIIKRRGPFSDFPYPEYVVELLLELVGKVVDRNANPHLQIRDVVDELENISSRNMNRVLRDKALSALGYIPPPHA